jgi:hypothetical protein
MELRGIGEGTFSNKSIASLQASVIDPPPIVRMQSALGHYTVLLDGGGNLFERTCSAISIASSHGEYEPTPAFAPVIVPERKSR